MTLTLRVGGLVLCATYFDALGNNHVKLYEFSLLLLNIWPKHKL